MLISVLLLAMALAGLAEELPGPAAAVPIRVATDRPKKPVAPKLAIDCPLPLRKLLSKLQCLSDVERQEQLADVV